MKAVKNFIAVNFVAATSVAIALGAFIISAYVAERQYRDDIRTKIVITGFDTKESSASIQTKLGLKTVANVLGNLTFLILNSGNRMISVYEFNIYLQTGNYEMLDNLPDLPKCNGQVGSKKLSSLASPDKLLSDSRAVDAEHISDGKIDFAIFSETDADTLTVEGLICVNLEAYDYNGRSSIVDFPVGIVKAIRKASPPSLTKQARGGLNKKKLQITARIF